MSSPYLSLFDLIFYLKTSNIIDIYWYINSLK